MLSIHTLSVNEVHLELTCNPNIANITNNILTSFVEQCNSSYSMIKSNKNDYKQQHYIHIK